MKLVSIALALLLTGCGHLVQQAEQQAIQRFQSLRIGESRSADVLSRYGSPQHEAGSVTQAGTIRVWSYYWNRMVIASAPPGDQVAVDGTLGLLRGLQENAAGGPLRSPVVRFIFVNDILTGVENAR